MDQRSASTNSSLLWQDLGSDELRTGRLLDLPLPLLYRIQCRVAPYRIGLLARLQSHSFHPIALQKLLFHSLCITGPMLLYRYSDKSAVSHAWRALTLAFHAEFCDALYSYETSHLP